MLHGRELLEYRMLQGHMRAMLAERDRDRAARRQRTSTLRVRPWRNGSRVGIVSVSSGLIRAFMRVVARRRRGDAVDAPSAATRRAPSASSNAGTPTEPARCLPGTACAIR